MQYLPQKRINEVLLTAFINWRTKHVFCFKYFFVPVGAKKNGNEINSHMFVAVYSKLPSEIICLKIECGVNEACNDLFLLSTPLII